MKFMIAHISKPGPTTNNSHQNYIIEKQTTNIDNIKWDDNKENTLHGGDWLMFYCWGTRVEIHKIISITTDHTKRPSHWDINNCNILHLSRCLNTYSFIDFEAYDAPYSVYGKGYKKKIVYELDKYNKLQYALNRQDTTTENTQAHPHIIEDEDVEMKPHLKSKNDKINKLIKLEKVKNDRKMKKTDAKKIENSIARLREMKLDRLNLELAHNQADLDKLIADLAHNQAELEAIMRGDRDEELIRRAIDNFIPQSILPRYYK